MWILKMCLNTGAPAAAAVCVYDLCRAVCPADGVLEGLLEHYMAELRSSATTSPCQQQGGGAGSISSEEGQTCGVCLDAAPTATINPCEHTMCGESKAAAWKG